mmetsp:Transcript_146935/g.409279  ORF Transcript_146935/g.409279 Transcript_146935/m.409279 type:complete len:185 (+) Transcript_146935:98-652(+)
MFLVLLLLPAVATASRTHIREPESMKQLSENATTAIDACTSDPLNLPRLLFPSCAIHCSFTGLEASYFGTSGNLTFSIGPFTTEIEMSGSLREFMVRAHVTVEAILGRHSNDELGQQFCQPVPQLKFPVLCAFFSAPKNSIAAHCSGRAAGHAAQGARTISGHAANATRSASDKISDLWSRWGR